MTAKPFSFLACLFAVLAAMPALCPAQTKSGIYVQTEARVNEWMEVAKDFEKDANWSEALNVYTWMINNPDYRDCMMQTEDGLFIRVPEYLRRHMLNGNERVKSYYRILYDVAAERGLKDAAEAFDPRQVEAIAEQFFASTHAPAAFFLAGDLYMEQGRLARAEACYRRVREYAADAPELDAGAIGRLAVLFSVRGSHRILQELYDSLPDAEARTISVRGEAVGLRDFIAAQLMKTTAESGWNEDVLSWPMFAGDAARTKPAYPDAGLGDLAWFGDLERLPDSAYATRRRGGRNSQGVTIPIDQVIPAINEKYIVCQTREYIYVREFRTGRLSFLRSDKPSVGALDQSYGQQFLPAVCAAALDGDILVTVDHRYTGGYNFMQTGAGNKVIAYDLSRGGSELTKLWEIGGVIESAPNGRGTVSVSLLDRLFWDFCPVVRDGTVYITAHNFSGSSPEVWMYALDLLSGEIKWKTFLFSREVRINNSLQLIAAYSTDLLNCISYGDGVLYYQSDIGAVCAVDARTGAIKWLRETQDAYNSGLRGSNLNPMLLHRGQLLYSPLERNRSVYMRASADGKLVWKRDLSAGEPQLIGVRGDVLVLTLTPPPNTSLPPSVVGLSLSQGGRELWRLHIPETITGRGALSDTAVYVPTAKGMYRVDIVDGVLARDASGAVLRRGNGQPKYDVHPDARLHPDFGFDYWSAHLRYGANAGPEYGDLVIVGKYIVRADSDRLYVFHNRADLQADLDRRVAADPMNPMGPYVLGSMHLYDRDYRSAARAFAAAVDLARGHATVSGDLLRDCEERMVHCYASLAAAEEGENRPAAAAELYATALEHAATPRLRLRIFLHILSMQVRLGEWEQAVTSLQRMIDETPQEVVEIDPLARMFGLGGTPPRDDSMISAASFARNKILWILRHQDEALAQTFDARAAGEFEAARAAENIAALGSLPYKYPLSRWIDDALLETASILLRDGRSGDALRSLRRFFAEFPDSDLRLAAVTAWVEAYRALGSEEGELRAQARYCEMIESVLPAVSPGGWVRPVPAPHAARMLSLRRAQGIQPPPAGATFAQTSVLKAATPALHMRLELLRNKSMLAEDQKLAVGIEWGTLRCWNVESGDQAWEWGVRFQGLGASFDTARGDMRVSDISEFSPLYQAGLRKADILTALDGAAIRSVPDLLAKYDSLDEGKYSLHCVRGNMPMNFTMYKRWQGDGGLVTAGEYTQEGLVAFRDNRLFLLRLDNGRAVWETPMTAQLMGVSLGLGEDIVVVVGHPLDRSSFTKVIVYDLFDGTELWSDIFQESFEPALRVQGGTIVLHTARQSTQAWVLDALTGAVRMIRPYLPVASGPGLAVQGGNLIVLEQPNLMRAYSLRASNVAWSMTLDVPMGTESSLLEVTTASGCERLIVMPLKNNLLAVNAADGAIAWSESDVFEADVSTAAAELFAAGEFLIGHYTKTESSPFKPRPRQIDYLWAYELETGRFLWGRVPLGDEKNRRLSVAAMGSRCLLVQSDAFLENVEEEKTKLMVYGFGDIRDGKIAQRILGLKPGREGISAFRLAGNRVVCLTTGGLCVFSAK